MYNRYINANGFDRFFKPVEDDGLRDVVPAVFEPVAEPVPEPEPPPQNKGLLGNLFGGNIKLPDLNADTLLLLVMVYFLVSDENENISDTLLIIGVLLLLGF